MPKPKPNMRFLINDGFISKGYTIVSDINYDNSNKNTLFKVKCKHNENHFFTASITWLLSNNIDTNCPHCKKEITHLERGMSISVAEKWASDNDLSFLPKKQFYNKWEKDEIEFTCNKCQDKLVVKALFYFETDTSKRKHVCNSCRKISIGILSQEEFEKKISKISHVLSDEVAVNSGPSLDLSLTRVLELKDEVDLSILSEKLKSSYLSQQNWRLVSYINTKQAASYQCLSCGNVKQYSPFSLFIGRGGGCLSCKNKSNKDGVVEKLKVICKKSNCYLVSEYKDVSTEMEFKCNSCGKNFLKSWERITGNRYRLFCTHCKNGTPIVTEQSDLCNFIKSVTNLPILQNDRKLISPLELDIVIPDKKIAIEYCGSIWHSTRFGKDSNYHANKLKQCNDIGYRLITVYDDEWKEKRTICESRLRYILGVSSVSLGARCCELSAIDNSVALEFLKHNHIQGSGHAHISYGLYRQDLLVSVMTFSKPSVAKNSSGYDWELNRFASLVGYSVPGAANRLLRAFTESHKNQKLITFCDLRWGTGVVYEKMGFTFDKQTSPNYYYIGEATGWQRKHRFGFTKSKLVEIFGTAWADYTEFEIADANNMFRVWDCGHMKFSMVL